MKNLFLLLLLSMYSVVNAQEYVINLKHWDVEDGLCHRQVNALMQDKTGFLWVGTAAGLDRFDGYSFVHYNKETCGLPFSSIDAIAEDGAGGIWLRTAAGPDNLCLLHPVSRRVVTLVKPFHRQMDFLHSMPDGSVIFGANNPGEWYRYHPTTGIRRIPVPLEEPFEFRGVTEHNTIWASRNHREFYELGAGGNVLRTWSLSGPSPVFFSDYKAGNGLFAVWDKSARVCQIDVARRVTDVSGYALVRDPSQLEYVSATGIDGIIWRQGALYHPAAGKLRDFPAEGWDDLGGLLRTSVQPRPGVLWLGGSFGFYRLTLRRSPFRRYLYDAKPAQDHHNSYRGISATDGEVFAASQDKGLMMQAKRTGSSSVLLFSAILHDVTRFCAMLRRGNGTFLFAVHRVLYAAGPAGTGISSYAGLGKDDEIWSMYEHTADSLLVGTNAGLGWITDRQRWLMPYTGYGAYPALAGATVHCINRQADGVLWLCTTNGLYTLDIRKGITGRYSALDTGTHFLPATTFYHYARDADGTWWLATGNGLIRWDKSAATHRSFTTADGLSNSAVYAVYPDDPGRIWMSSDYGLMRMDTKSGAIKTYLTDDGISSNEFNRISHFRDSSGTLYFGSINGITAFHPKDFRDEKDTVNLPARLVINSFQQFEGDSNRLVDRTAELLRTATIRLTPEDRFFLIELALLNYSDPERTTYYWKIDGVSRAWNLQQDRTIRFSSLPYGRYRLQLRARSSNGVWSANEWTFDLYVPAPFYRTAPFIILISLLLAGGIAGLSFRRARRRHIEKKRLECTVRARTADLKASLFQKDILMKEIHHRVKNNLQVISALQQMQSTRSSDPGVKAALEDSQNRVLSIAFIHHNLYMHDDLKGVEIASFVDELTGHIAAVFGIPSQEITIGRDIPQLAIDIDTAVPLGLMINELLTNSYKYAFAGRTKGRIAIGLTAGGDGSYQLQYDDDGPGLPEGIRFGAVKTLGLLLISQLSEQLNGTIHYSGKTGFHFVLHFSDFETRSQLD